jgi:hypothetical protein
MIHYDAIMVVNYIETSVRTALAIFCKLKPESMVKNIKIIAVIFGRERGLYYYTGNKVQFTTYPGHALFRGQMIKKVRFRFFSTPTGLLDDYSYTNAIATPCSLHLHVPYFLC